MSEKSIIVYCETSKGKLAPIATEALGAGRRLADQTGGGVIGVAIGTDAGRIATEALHYGADECYTADLPELADYQTDAYVAVFEAVNHSLEPAMIIMGQTGVGRDLAPALAAHLDSAAVLDCVELAIDPESQRLLMTKPVYGGNAGAVFTTDFNPQIVTIRAKAMNPLEPDVSRTGDIMALDVKIEKNRVRAKLVEKVPEQVDGIRLEDARVVFGGGRGLGGPESFAKLETIAAMLKGTVGASRAACDNGWIPSTKQIGLTGKVVTPELYFAVGISGASQHMAGCHGASYIIAVNNDDGAHIFNEAHFGIVGDWEPVLNGFVEKLREMGIS